MDISGLSDPRSERQNISKIVDFEREFRVLAIGDSSHADEKKHRTRYHLAHYYYSLGPRYIFY